jgi:crotonobetainyl-CoA:carnitine CoA-transferase CaiB-like acyl-CoA transferase
MPDSALSDVVVLELATGVAGAYTGRLLADLGAQVIKAEPPGGDPLRSSWPQRGGESAFFNFLNAGKFGVEGGPGDPRAVELAAHADIVLHNARGTVAQALEGHVQRANPHAIVVSFTPYGRSGQRSGWETTELTEYATSGYGYIGGDPNREPLALPGHQVEFHAGLHGGVAALAGLWHARNTGAGQLVEVSHQEATLSDHSWFVTSWTHQGISQKRTGSAYVPCADGFVFLFNLVPYKNLFLLLERMDLYEDESLEVPANWWARYPEIMQAFAQWTATRTKQEVYHACQEIRIAASPVNTMADVAGNPQLLAREWFSQLDVAGEPFQAPGPAWRLTATPATPGGRAPRVGEHNAFVFGDRFRWANAGAELAHRDLSNGSGPLSGLRVIEVTANWAGPAGGRHFADLGADVIKVELATKPATRAIAYVHDDPTWPFHYNRAGYFNKLNRNKRDICLDLSRPAGRLVFLDLVAKSDVVIENNAARVMGNLGLDFAALSEVNAGIIMCSMSGYGGTGPERNYSAYGSNIETASGLASVLGYGPGEHFGTGTFYADPVSGNQGAVAVLAALHARRRTGKGQWIDISLLEAVTPFFAQPFLEYTVNGKVPMPMGNRSREFAPQGYYRCAGDDSWLAVTVRDERDWRALCGAIGNDGLRDDPALGTLDGRRARHDEIDAAINAWSAPLDHNRAARLLQEAGVPAAPVMQNWEVLGDNHLNARGFFVRISHPEAGTHLWPGFPYLLAETPAGVYRPAPMFAEHNREVFEGLLGLSPADVAQLYDEGITSDVPIYAGGPGL